jgi:hypothetical protein
MFREINQPFNGESLEKLTCRSLDRPRKGTLNCEQKSKKLKEVSKKYKKLLKKD